MMNVSLILTAAGLMGAFGQGAGVASAAEEVAGTKMEVEVHSLGFEAFHAFAAPPPFVREEQATGAGLRVGVRVRPAAGSPILGNRPEVRITRLTDEAGEDLLTKVAARTGDEVPTEGEEGPGVLGRGRREGRGTWGPGGWGVSPYLFRRGANESGGNDTPIYEVGVLGNVRVPVDALPSGIGEMEGEAIVEVVTQDATRERMIGTRRIDEELAPGVRLSVVPGRGFGRPTRAWAVHSHTRRVATYGLSGREPLGVGGLFQVPPDLQVLVSDEEAWPWAGSRPGRVSYRTFPITSASGERIVPVVNIMRVTSPNGPWPANFTSTKLPDGTMSGEALLGEPRMMAGRSCALRAHIVYRTERVTVPFRYTDLRTSSGAGGGGGRGGTASGGEAAGRDLAVRADGYELRLLNVGADGGMLFGALEQHAVPSSLTLGLGLRHTGAGAAFGGRAALRIDEMTDESGGALGSWAQEMPATPRDRWGGSWVMYSPRPALPFEEGEGEKNATNAEGPQEYSVRAMCEPLPARIGVMRGAFSFSEVTNDTVLDIPLEPWRREVEVAPGMFLTAVTQGGFGKEQTVGPPAPTTVQYELEMPGAPEQRAPGRSLPLLNMVQFTRGGQTLPPETMIRLNTERRGDRIVHTFGRFPFATPPSSVRLHIVLETRPRVIPFEFKDLPCGSP